MGSTGGVVMRETKHQKLFHNWQEIERHPRLVFYGFGALERQIVEYLLLVGQPFTVVIAP